MTTSLRIRLAGATAERSAYSIINAHWWRALTDLGHQVLGEPDEGPCDATIVHDYSRRFTEPPPRSGPEPRVTVRPWDFGPYPQAWVETVGSGYDELWVPSEWSRQQAVAGGSPPERVRVVPFGIDPVVLHPDGPHHPATSSARTTFLFVGAAVLRKGVDLALDAYEAAFTAEDDVVLVVQAHGSDVFYGGQELTARLATMAGGAGPRVVHLDQFLTEADLAALYRGADALLLPYRAEGFALTPLEAMACGTPPVVPAFGACLDYCDALSAVLVPVRRISLPVGRSITFNALGFTEEVAEVDFCEPDRVALTATLQALADESDAERAPRRQAAAARAAAWTWARSAEVVVAGLRSLRR